VVAVNGDSNGVGFIARLRAAASTLSSRAELASRAGLTFGGKRNFNTALGYVDTVSPEAYRLRYERGGVAKRLVKAYPKATWGAGGAVFDEDPGVETAFEKAVKEVFTRLEVWPRLLRLDILAGLGQYGALLIGTANGFEGEATPAPVLYLTPLSEEMAKIDRREDTVKDAGSERFGLVEYYRVKIGANLTEKRIHHSHLLHFVEGNLSDDVFGEPRLRASWNYFDDLMKLVGGGGEAAWRRARPIRHANIDPEMGAGLSDAELEAEKEKYRTEIDAVEHELSSWLKTSGVDITALDGAPFNFDSNAKFVLALIAATEDIPQRKLLGSGIGEMTGKMEDDSFNDAVAERRQTLAEPFLRRLVERFIEGGTLPEPAGGEFFIEWPEEEELDEGAKADLVSKIATANKAQAEATGEPVMLSNEIRDKYLGMEPLPEPSADELEAEAAAEATAKAVAEEAAAADEEDPEGAPSPALGDRAAAAAEPAWKATHKVADAYAPRLERAFRRAFDAVRGKVDMAALEAAAAAGNRAQAEQLLSEAVAGFGAALDEELPAQVATLFAEGG
jgi:hypothetical protein